MKYFIGYLVNGLAKQVSKIRNWYIQPNYYKRCGKIGKDVFFNGVLNITGIENMEVGDNVHFGRGAWIRAEGGLVIGNNVQIAGNLICYTHVHNHRGEALPFDDTYIDRKVVIGDNVWIGIGVTILPGSVIEEGAIIVAGSLVSGRVPACSIYGNPAKKIYARNKEHYEKLKNKKSFGGVNGKRY